MGLDWVSQNAGRKIALIVLSVWLTGAYAAGSPQQAAQGSTSDLELATRIRAYLAPFAESGNLSGVVLVARHGRVLMRESYGMANYELSIPNSPRTRFHIASVSKAFTAAAILQLQEKGSLSVSDRVSRFVPDFPRGADITLDNLLTHTSGIPDINDLPDYDTFSRNPHTLTEIIAKFANLPLEFEPGTKYSYSNSNYNLLAFILEKVTRQAYSEVLHRGILQAAGMTNSGHDGDAAKPIPFAAAGYAPAGVKGYDKAVYVDWSNKTGNGSLFSTVDDLWRFDRALKAEALLKSSTRRTYFVEGVGNRYGWYIGRRLGHRVMSGKGRSPGFAAELDRYPDDDLTVILLSNSYSSVTQDPIAEAIAGIVFGQRATVPNMRAAVVPQSILLSYEDHYQFGPDFFAPDEKFRLIAQPSYVLLQLANESQPLVPLSPTEFLERKFFGHIVAEKDDQGKVIGLIVRYGTQDFHARRLDAEPGISQIKK
jgi:CubicO group peptidase (beta-lactamase class C family)